MKARQGFERLLLVLTAAWIVAGLAAGFADQFWLPGVAFWIGATGGVWVIFYSLVWALSGFASDDTKRPVGRQLAAALAVCAIGAAIGFVPPALEESLQKFAPIVPQNEYWGINLGINENDVIFLKGAPSEREETTINEQDTNWTCGDLDETGRWDVEPVEHEPDADVDSSTSVRLHYTDLNKYSGPEGCIVWLEGNDGVNQVRCWGRNAAEIFGVSVGTSLQGLYERLGEPDTIYQCRSKSKEEPSVLRIFNYPELQTRFMLQEGEVSLIGIKKFSNVTR